MAHSWISSYNSRSISTGKSSILVQACDEWTRGMLPADLNEGREVSNWLGIPQLWRESNSMSGLSTCYGRKVGPDLLQCCWRARRCDLSRLFSYPSMSSLLKYILATELQLSQHATNTESPDLASIPLSCSFGPIIIHRWSQSPLQ